jgi:hypothetical protein
MKPTTNPAFTKLAFGERVKRTRFLRSCRVTPDYQQLVDGLAVRHFSRNLVDETTLVLSRLVSRK